PLEAVREVGPGEGEVLIDDAPVRVAGSSGECNAVQVRLARGDRVTLVARDATPDGSEWWSIDPPAGEFRWVSRAALEPLPRTQPAVTPREVEPPAQPRIDTLGVAPIAPVEADSPPRDVPAAFPTTDFAASPPFAAQPAVTAQPSPRTLPPITPLGGDFAQRLTALELALATIVVERPNLWRFESLETEAAALLVASPTEGDRQAVRALAERIDRFGAIGDRYRAGRASAEAVAGGAWRRSSERSAANPMAIAEPDGGVARVPSDVRLTATRTGGNAAEGVLRPVVSQRPGAPKFALVDDRGRVTTLVTPSTGVDLAPLVGRRLSVDGPPGFVPEYNRPHVTAERVTALETYRR
ncbi:MAG: hypothetical protein ACRCT8_02415, partial [Lacipirellulaceae bacterium]